MCVVMFSPFFPASEGIYPGPHAYDNLLSNGFGLDPLFFGVRLPVFGPRRKADIFLKLFPISFKL